MAVDRFELARGRVRLRGRITAMLHQYSLRTEVLYTVVCVVLLWHARVQTSSAIC